jgi:adenylate cyclase
MTAFADMVNGDYAAATNLAVRSITANPRHTSSYRVLAITQHFMGKTDDAKITVRKLMALELELTIKRHLQSHPASNQATGQAWASALQAAGVPPN